MKSVWHRARGFSLVELTLALGVAAFCLIAVFGVIPVGVQTNRNATSQTAATELIALAVSDLRAATTISQVSPLLSLPFPCDPTCPPPTCPYGTTCQDFVPPDFVPCSPPGQTSTTSKVLYFDSQLQSQSISKSRYRLTATPLKNTTAAA